MDGAGYGKAQRGRRHRPQGGPYSRAAPKPRPSTVPVLGSYFAPAAAATEVPPVPPEAAGDSGDADIEVVLESAAQDVDGNASHDLSAEAEEQQQQQQQQQQPAGVAGSGADVPQQHARPAGQRRVAFQSLASSEKAATTPPAQQRDTDAGNGAGGTPYDNVLAMLAKGPLAANSPRSFPRPRSNSLLTAGAGRTPGPAQAIDLAGAAASPSPLLPNASVRRGGYTGSRLGPTLGVGGSSSTPSTGMRTTYTARSNSRFSRTPVHMQPLAAGAPPGSGGGSGGATSRFGLAAAAAASASAAPGAADGGNALLSPAPLAWTPMRSNLATGGRAVPVGGLKRKAASASPDNAAGEGSDAGNISLLDAQRRIRQKPEPTGDAASNMDRRSWRAGRTPFHPKGAGLSRFGSNLQPPTDSIAGAASEQQAHIAVPGLLAGAVEEKKTTTDTARRILATLDALDRAVAASPPGGAATVPGMGREPQQNERVGLSPPPSDSLGFAGLPRAGTGPEPAAAPHGEQQVQPKGVTFGGVSFAPSPKPAAPPAVLDVNGGSSSSGAAAREAARTEDAGSTRTQLQQPAAGAFSFGLPSEPTPSGDTPKIKQRLEKPAAASDQAADAEPAAAAPAPLFSFATAGSKPAAPAPATAPFAFGIPPPEGSIARSAAAAAATPPQFSFGSKRSTDTDQKVAAIVGAASASHAAGPEPSFTFGAKKAHEDAADKASPLGFEIVADALQANKTAAEAAKLPLPDSDDEPDAGAAPAETKPAEAAKPVASTGGWDLSFLQKNKAAAQQATEAAAKEVEASKPGGAPAAAPAAPKFTFGAPLEAASAAASTAAAAPSFISLAPAAASNEASTSAPSFTFGGAAAASSAAAVSFSFGAAPSAASQPAASSAPASCAAAVASASGWGEAFLKANQSAASKAADAAAQEIDTAAGRNSSGAPGASSSSSAFQFGLPASSSAASAPAFSFGVSSSAAGGASSAPAFSFGMAASAPAPATEQGTAPSLSFGAAAAAASAPAVSFNFGGAASAAETAAPSTAAAAASSTPAFSLSAAQQAAAPFAFGSTPASAPAPAPSSSAASAPVFNFGAAAQQPALGSGSATFTFGSQPAAQPAASTASATTAPVFSFGASAPAASSAAGAPSFMFGAASAPAVPDNSAPAAGFSSGGFGFSGLPAASSAAGSAPVTFGGAAAASQAAPGGFAFGAGAGQANGMGGGGMESDMMDNGGMASAAAPISGFQFGTAPPASAPAFGAPPSTTFGFGQQQQPAAPMFGGSSSGFGAGAASQPAFAAFGSQTAAPAFGAPPTAPAFGSAQQQPAFGATPSFGGFAGAPQQQSGAPAFGGMIPNNPFNGGGGFSMGSSGGGSQSEGRRKLKVKRAGSRKP